MFCFSFSRGISVYIEQDMAYTRHILFRKQLSLIRKLIGREIFRRHILIPWQRMCTVSSMSVTVSILTNEYWILLTCKQSDLNLVNVSSWIWICYSWINSFEGDHTCHLTSFVGKGCVVCHTVLPSRVWDWKIGESLLR